MPTQRTPGTLYGMPTPLPPGTHWAHTFNQLAYPLTPWDSESESRITSQTFLGQFVLVSMYKGMQAFCPVPSRINWYHLILTQYHQVPTIAVLYCPSTQLYHLVTHSLARLTHAQGKVLDTLLCLEILLFSDGALVSSEDFEYFIGSKY